MPLCSTDLSKILRTSWLATAGKMFSVQPTHGPCLKYSVTHCQATHQQSQLSLVGLHNFHEIHHNVFSIDQLHVLQEFLHSVAVELCCFQQRQKRAVSCVPAVSQMSTDVIVLPAPQVSQGFPVVLTVSLQLLANPLEDRLTQTQQAGVDSRVDAVAARSLPIICHTQRSPLVTKSLTMRHLFDWQLNPMAFVFSEKERERGREREGG